MAAVRWGLVAVSLVALPFLSIALGGQRMPTPFARLLRFLQQVGEWVFVIPKSEAKLLEGVNNPVFRHMVRATRWRLSWLPYFGALLFGFALSFAPSVVFATQWLIGFLLAPLFWFASYQAVHRYLRKLHQTGELWQWLITPLPSRAIVNGLRWGGWWWQMRWLGLVFWFSVGCVLSGQNLLGFLRLPLPPPPFVLPALQVVNLFAVGVYLLFWIALTFGAVPVAINEIFRHSPTSLRTRRDDVGKDASRRLCCLDFHPQLHLRVHHAGLRTKRPLHAVGDIGAGLGRHPPRPNGAVATNLNGSE